MTDETRKRIERELGVKILGAPVMAVCPVSPMDDFHDAWELLGRLVENSAGKNVNLALLISRPLVRDTRFASIHIGGLHGSSWGATAAAALSLAIADLVEIDTEDGNE